MPTVGKDVAPASRNNEDSGLWVPDRVRCRSLVRDDGDRDFRFVFSNFESAQNPRSAACARVVAPSHPPKSEGAGKTGCALHPRSRVQIGSQKKRTRAYRFSGNTPAFPAQWLTAYSVLSPVNGFLATVICGCFTAHLAPAPRRQDHTTLPYASCRARQSQHARPPHLPARS